VNTCMHATYLDVLTFHIHHALVTGTVQHQAQQHNLSTARHATPDTHDAHQSRDATDPSGSPLTSPDRPEQQYQVPFSSPDDEHPQLHHHVSSRAGSGDAAASRPAAGDPAGLLTGKGIFRDELFTGTGSGSADKPRKAPTSSAAASAPAAAQAAATGSPAQQDQICSQQGTGSSHVEGEEPLLQEPNPFADPAPGPFSHRPSPSSSTELARQAHVAQEGAAQQLGTRGTGNPQPFIQGDEGPDIGPHHANRKGIIARAYPSGQGLDKGSGAAGPAPVGGGPGMGPAVAGAESDASTTGRGSSQGAQQPARGFGVPKTRRARADKKKRGRRQREDGATGGCPGRVLVGPGPAVLCIVLSGPALPRHCSAQTAEEGPVDESCAVVLHSQTRAMPALGVSRGHAVPPGP
jgi:hypothetical protein